MTDSIIYEAQPIPPRDPRDGKRQKWSAIFGAVAVIAVLLVGVAFGAALFRGTAEPDPLAEPDPTQPTATLQTTTTTTTSGSPLASRAQRSESFLGGGDHAISRPALPGGDVGAPTPPLPAQEFTWERITLHLPEGEEAYLHGVYAVNDGFLAVGMSWSEENQRIVVWKSADGLAWEPAELNGDFSNSNVWNVVFNDYGAVAFGEEWTGSEGDGELYRGYAAPVRLIWTSPDGVNWTRTELDLTTADNQEVWINTGTAGPDGFLVVGHRSTSPEFEPMLIEKDGYTLEINEYSYSYRVTDAAGTVVAEGSMEDIYRHTYDEDGQVIVNPNTGEILTVVPWETWEMAWEEAYSESEGGPFGGFGYVPPNFTVEVDGYFITVDEEAYTYEIEDADGALIASGDLDFLWRGPAPVITDAEGNEILRFTWEEFDAAQETFWRRAEHQEYDYHSEAVVAHSSDGVTWTEAVIETAAQEVSFDSVIARDGGFLAYGSQYDEYGGGPAIWASTDGLSWDQVADMPGGMYIWNVQPTAEGTLLAIGEGPQGQALWSSTDGIAWGEAFGTRIPEDRSQYEYLNQFGTGELGTVVVGSREQNYYDEEYYASNPLILTQGDYTLTFNDYDWPPRVTVIDNQTEDVVIDVQLLEEGGLPEGFYYEDGVTYIENNDLVLLSITDEEWRQTQEEHWMALEQSYVYQPAQTSMYFSTDLSEWTEVPFDFQGWIGHVAIGADRVVVAGEEYFEEPMIHDEEFEYTPPAPVIFVGRP